MKKAMAHIDEFAGRFGEVREVARTGRYRLGGRSEETIGSDRDTQAAMRKRVLPSFDRGRENLFDQLADLDSVLEVKAKLKD